MNINNRKIAAIYRVLAAFIGIVTIFNELGLFSSKLQMWNIFYFTTISNLLCVIMFVVLSIKTIKEIKLYGIKGSTSISSHIKGGITIAIILTMSVYHFILIPYALKEDPTRRLGITDVILHYLIPCLTIFDWILFDEKKRFKIYDPIVWTIFPYLYITFIYIQARYELIEKMNIGISKYIYVFLDLDFLGIQAVGENIIKISVFFIIIGYILYAIDSIRIQNDEKNLEKI